MAYLAVATQWQYAGLGERTGLNYAGCMPVLTALLAREQRAGRMVEATEADVLEDVQVIEAAILEVDAERRERAAQQRAQAPGGADPWP